MTEAPRKIEPAADGLDQLKTLLFQGEARRLADIEKAVERIDQRVGNALRLEKATAEILVEAFRDAEVKQHRELADAVAPVVVAAIRNEIRNSREMMVEALYPLTGQLVVAAVQNAFRELVASLNQRIDALTSRERWKLQIRSRLSGRPVSELAIVGSGRGRVVRLLFLEAGSGRLIDSWRLDAVEDDRADLAGGLIAAITGFARDALDVGSNELRMLDFGGRKTFLRNSPFSIVAAEVLGDLSSEQIAALDQAFGRLINAQIETQQIDTGNLPAFAAAVNEAGATQPAQSSGAVLKITAALVVAGLCFLVWRAGTRWWDQRQLDAAVADVVQARPYLKAFPLRARLDRSADRIELSGMAPSPADAAAVKSAVQGRAGKYTVVENIALVASRDTTQNLQDEQQNEQNARAAETGSLRGQLAAASAQMAALTARLDAQAGATDQRFAQHANALDATAAASAETARQRDARLSTLEAASTKPSSPEARLLGFARDFAIFFSDRDTMLDEASVAPRLDALATLLRDNSLGLRVVGHSDASGSPTANLAVSRVRADTVINMLVERGVERKKMVAAPRSSNTPIADAEGPYRERNRRVTFEPLFEREGGP